LLLARRTNSKQGHTGGGGVAVEARLAIDSRATADGPGAERSGHANAEAASGDAGDQEAHGECDDEKTRHLKTERKKEKRN
jgi:hypothetical protein